MHASIIIRNVHGEVESTAERIITISLHTRVRVTYTGGQWPKIRFLLISSFPVYNYHSVKLTKFSSSSPKSGHDTIQMYFMVCRKRFGSLRFSLVVITPNRGLY